MGRVGDDGNGEEATAALFDRYGSLAYALAYRVVRDHGIAEDVVQEAFLSVWRNAGRFDPGRGSMRTWLCQIVRNRALDRLRGRSLRQRGDRPLDELMLLASASDVVGDVVRRDEARAVAEAVACLSAPQRETIELAYYGGYTQTEIAAMTSRPLGTVKSVTRSAMRSLAASLSPLRSDPVAEAV